MGVLAKLQPGRAATIQRPHGCPSEEMLRNDESAAGYGLDARGGSVPLSFSIHFKTHMTSHSFSFFLSIHDRAIAF